MGEMKENKTWDGVEVEEVAVENITEHISASARSGGIGMAHWFFCDDSISWS